MKLNQWLQQQRGRQAALAAHLGMKPPTVSDWGAGQKQIPLVHCPAIQEFTGGAVTCEELRPDKVAYFALIRQQAGQQDARPMGQPSEANRAVGLA
ncbi:MAG: YdaS family helix-turn-helix protein [Ramlibacter sp.]